MITNCLCQTTDLKIYILKNHCCKCLNFLLFRDFLLENVAIPGIILKGFKIFFIESLSLWLEWFFFNIIYKFIAWTLSTGLKGTYFPKIILPTLFIHVCAYIQGIKYPYIWKILFFNPLLKKYILKFKFLNITCFWEKCLFSNKEQNGELPYSFWYRTRTW